MGTSTRIPGAGPIILSPKLKLETIRADTCSNKVTQIVKESINAELKQLMEGVEVTIQSYDIAATQSLYEHARAENEHPAPPETATGPELETVAARSDRVFISSAAHIYSRFVRRVNSVLEQYIQDKTN